MWRFWQFLEKPNSFAVSFSARRNLTLWLCKCKQRPRLLRVSFAFMCVTEAQNKHNSCTLDQYVQLLVQHDSNRPKTPTINKTCAVNFSSGPLGKRVVCSGHNRRFVEALDCLVNLLDHWSWFGSEGSHTTRVLTLFMAKLKKAKQKSKTDEKSLEITGGCVCEGEGAERFFPFYQYLCAS